MAYKDYQLQAYFHVPLSALTSSTLEQFGRLLDPARTTLSKHGLEQDWQGLAELMEYSYENIKVKIFNSSYLLFQDRFITRIWLQILVLH